MYDGTRMLNRSRSASATAIAAASDSGRPPLAVRSVSTRRSTKLIWRHRWSCWGCRDRHDLSRSASRATRGGPPPKGTVAQSHSSRTL
jgi:hypothetical protein